MNSFAIIFVSSLTLFLHFKQLPISVVGLLLLVTILVWFRITYYRLRLWIYAVVGAVLLVQITFFIQLSHQLETRFQGLTLTLQGRVVDIPRYQTGRVKFRLQVEGYESSPAPYKVKNLSLSWYTAQPKRVEPGQLWRFRVKLRSAYDHANPGSFDYPGWLFRQKIHAIGYVVSGDHNQLLSVAPSISATRLALANRLADAAGGASHLGLMQALLVGVRSAVDSSTWDLLRATGTSHLLAISGLHIGMLAGWGFMAGGLLWSLLQWSSGRLLRSWRAAPIQRYHAPGLNRQDFAALLSLLAALVYAALAGFTLPTQRALIMLSVVLLLRLSRRHSTRFTPVSLALLLILLIDPLAPLSAGFWLSFCAVLILLGSAFWQSRSDHLWKRLLVVHLAMGILMFPLTALFFAQGSLVAPLANLLAVPLVSFLVVPPLMGWLLLSPWAPFAAQYLLDWTQHALSLLLHILQLLKQWLPAELLLRSVTPLEFGTLLCAGLLLLFPVIRYQRRLVLALLLPFCWTQAAPLAADRLQLTILNVGDATAVIIRLAGHTVVYAGEGRSQQGAGRRRNRNTSSRVASALLAYLRDQGVRRIDRLVLADSSRTSQRLATKLRSALVIHSSAAPVTITSQSRVSSVVDWPCGPDSDWHFGAAEFALRSVAAGGRLQNAACILSLRYGQNTMLMGNLWPRELTQALAQAGKAPLSLLVLQVSKQQDEKFESELENHATIRAETAVEHVVLSTAPAAGDDLAHESVQMRYKIRGAVAYRTDVSGAIRFTFSPAGLSATPRQFRDSKLRAWHKQHN